ncbi:hypothetical protein [Tolypothrix sp. VBCCA 56010]|uniref:hypothetical protein n=1 Tax=Tolypothrix sp. VBCCA 56010 TaxID=3137731 RepID=UPI003D7E890E
MKKWLTDQWVWLFIVGVIASFGVMLVINNPMSLEKQCAAINLADPSPDVGERAGESVQGHYVRQQEYKRLIERCQSLKN